MVEVFFRSLPRTICLVLSALPADTEIVPREGAILAPLSGKFTIKLVGKNVTAPDNLNGVSFRAVGDGTRWVLEELHDNGQSVSPDVVRNVANGDTDGPRLILASKITLRKLRRAEFARPKWLFASVERNIAQLLQLPGVSLRRQIG